MSHRIDLTDDELRVLRERFIRCASHPSPDDLPVIERVVALLSGQAR